MNDDNNNPNIKVISGGDLGELLKLLAGGSNQVEHENTPAQQEFADRMDAKLEAECKRLHDEPKATSVIYADVKDVHRAFHMVSKGMMGLMSKEDVLEGQSLAHVENADDYKMIVKITIEYAGDSNFGNSESVN